MVILSFAVVFSLLSLATFTIVGAIDFKISFWFSFKKYFMAVSEASKTSTLPEIKLVSVVASPL